MFFIKCLFIFYFFCLFCGAVHRCTLSRAVCCPVVPSAALSALRETVTDSSISMITGFPLPHKPWWPCTAGGPRRSSTPNWYSTLMPDHVHLSLCTERTEGQGQELISRIEMCPAKYCKRLFIIVILPWLRAAFPPQKLTALHDLEWLIAFIKQQVDTNSYICVYKLILVRVNKSYVKLHSSWA